MSTLANLGLYTKVSIKNSAGLFDDLAELVGLTPPQLSRDTPDVTHSASPSNYRECVSGLRDTGEVSLELNYVPGGDTNTLLIQHYLNGAEASLDLNFIANTYGSGGVNQPSIYKITYPDNSVVQFEGHLSGVSPAVPLDDKMTQSITIKPTGKSN